MLLQGSLVHVVAEKSKYVSSIAVYFQASDTSGRSGIAINIVIFSNFLERRKFLASKSPPPPLSSCVCAVSCFQACTRLHTKLHVLYSSHHRSATMMVAASCWLRPASAGCNTECSHHDGNKRIRWILLRNCLFITKMFIPMLIMSYLMHQLLPTASVNFEKTVLSDEYCAWATESGPQVRPASFVT